MAEARRLISVEARPELLNRYTATAAKGIAETIKKQPFCILVVNVSNQRIHLPKQIRITIAALAPDKMYELNLFSCEGNKESRKTKFRFNPKVTVIKADSSIYNRALNDQQLGTRKTAESIPMTGLQPEPDIEKIKKFAAHAMDGYNNANQKIEAGGTLDWRTNINISDTYSRHRKELEGILEPFADMWDGQIGHIKATVHSIELKPNLKPIFQHVYRAEPKLCQLEKEKDAQESRQ